MPLPLLIVIPVVFGLVVALWPWICDFLQTKLIPWVKKKLGPGFAGALADLVVFLDGKVTPLRASVAKAVAAFRRGVLGIKTTYTKESANAATATTESYLQESGRFYKVTQEEEVDWDTLPAEIREAMIRQQAKQGTLDQLPVIEKAIQKRAQEENMLDLAVA